MTFEPDGIVWKQAGTKEKLACYHCGFMGCSVRYAPEHGYFTVVNAPDLPVFIEEPAVNTLQCPAHATWLYRRVQPHSETFEWGCATGGCDYCHPDVPGHWLRE
jgi:hypothetical protein